LNGVNPYPANTQKRRGPKSLAGLIFAPQLRKKAITVPVMRSAKAIG